jgi:hypothetical protein
VICVAAALGAVTAGIAFPRRPRPEEADVPLPETAVDDTLVPIPVEE